MSRQYLGVDETRVDTTAEFELGTIAYKDDGRSFMYVEANGVIANKRGVKVAAAFLATESGNVGAIEGASVAGVALADGEFFWMQLTGLVPNFNVADAATVGQLMALQADANGDGIVISVTPSLTGAHQVRGKILENAAAGVADVMLY